MRGRRWVSFYSKSIFAESGNGETQVTLAKCSPSAASADFPPCPCSLFLFLSSLQYGRETDGLLLAHRHPNKQANRQAVVPAERASGIEGNAAALSRRRRRRRRGKSANRSGTPKPWQGETTRRTLPHSKCFSRLKSNSNLRLHRRLRTNERPEAYCRRWLLPLRVRVVRLRQCLLVPQSSR